MTTLAFMGRFSSLIFCSSGAIGSRLRVRNRSFQALRAPKMLGAWPHSYGTALVQGGKIPIAFGAARGTVRAMSVKAVIARLLGPKASRRIRRALGREPF